MGVKVRDTIPEMRMAMVTVKANSLNSRPTSPPMNMMGMNTATSDRVMDTTVKPISRVPISAACMGLSPFSR